MKKCKRHRLRVGSGIGELVFGKLVKTKLNIWCENCNIKIKAHYFSKDKFELKKRLKQER